MSNFPTEPGYYWAKLKTPSGGTLYFGEGQKAEFPACEEDVSPDWEIVQVNQNAPAWTDKNSPEYFSVNVFGIPVTQWPLDFFWGPKVREAKP